jgi:hypothetical protein
VRLGIVLAHEFFDDSRGKAVEARRDRGVRGEDVSGPGDRQCDFEWLPGILCEAAGTLQHREGRVPLVEMADLGLEPEHAQQPPAPDPQQELLLQSQLRSTPVQLAGDAADGGRVRRVVAVEEIEDDPTDPDLPGAKPDLVARQLDREAKQVAALGPHRGDRQLVGIVVRVERLLAAIGGDHLTEISLLVQQADADHRHAEVAGRLELVARDVAETTRVNRQRLAQRKFHAEVRHPSEGRLPVRLLKPGWRLQVLTSPIEQAVDPASEIWSRQDVLNSARGDRLKHDPRVVRQGPELGVELGPHLVITVTP